VESINEVLQGIAEHIFHGKHGTFLQIIAAAYLQADEANREILKPVFQTFIDKYLVKNEVAQEA